MYRFLRRRHRGTVALVLIFTALVLYVAPWRRKSSSGHEPTSPWHGSMSKDAASSKTPSVALIVASRLSDNTTWVEDVSQLWEKYIYVADDRNAKYSIPKNKGREAMAYLTYIIDHYSTLPSIAIFHHANRYQWHNDDPYYDAQKLLAQLRPQYVLTRGYTNLRCVWTIGCPPDGIYPHQPTTPMAPNPLDYNSIYKEVYQVLFPGEPVPEQIRAPCCAQFAVTANTIRRQPKHEYERLRKWLLETELKDEVSGRVMEYLWHVIFGKPTVDCPPAKDCYCGLYGLCDLNCESEGVCGRWKRPMPGVDSHGQW